MQKLFDFVPSEAKPDRGQNYRRMWWVKKLPTSSRLAPKLRVFQPVDRIAKLG